MIFNDPIYSAQGGGTLFFYVQSTTTDYSDQLVSVDGLTKKVDFSGGIYHPEITVQIAGGGLQNGDGVGTILSVCMADSAGNMLTGWGDFVIMSIEVIQKSAKIIARGALSQQTPEDYNQYVTTAQEPRALARNWLRAASGAAMSNQAMWYTDVASVRADARLAAPATTLSGIATLMGENGGNFARTEVQLGTQADSSTWTGTKYTAYDVPVAWDWQCDFAPGYSSRGVMCGKNALYWHQYNSYVIMEGIFRQQDPATSSDKGQFPLGVVQYGWFDVGYYGYINNSVKWLSQTNNTLKPSTTQNITITFKTRKEARNYWAQNTATGGYEGIGQQYGYTLSGQVVDRKQKTVTFRNVATYSGIQAGWYEQAKATLAPTAPAISTATPGELAEWPDILFQSKSFLPGIITDPTGDGIMSANVQIVPQNASALWQTAGINGLSTLRPGYRFVQWLYPCTVAQEYTRKEHFIDACTLGTCGFYQNASGGYEQTDVCRDAEPVLGVFLMPVDIHTTIAVQSGATYPIAKNWQLDFVDPHGGEYSYHFTDPTLPGDTSATLKTLQGQLYGGQSPASAGSYKTLAIGSRWWEQNPGNLADRWHGSTVSGNDMISLNSDATPALGACLLTSAGTTLDLYGGKNFADFAMLSGYAIRGRDGIEKRLFAHNTSKICLDNSANVDTTSADPLLDIFPLLSMLAAYKRVFSDNLGRQSFEVQTTMAFASAEPGNIVAVQLPQILDNAKTLAVVIAVSVNTTGRCILEIVPTHKITAQDYIDFHGLDKVMP